MALQTQYVQIVNNTGYTIKDGVVTHISETPAYGVQSISLAGLANGATSVTLACGTGPSSTDYWYISWSVDGVNYLCWSGDSSLKDHTSSTSPGSITLVGALTNQGVPGWQLQVEPMVQFLTKGTSQDNEDVPAPDPNPAVVPA